MSGPRVLVTRPIASEALEILRSACQVSLGPERGEFSRSELLAAVRECQGLLVVGHPRVDGALLDAAPDLRVVSNFGVGVDHIDVAAATARGVWVTNTAGSLTETTAELAWGLILAAARRIAEGDRLVRQNLWKGFGPFFFLGMELTGKTLGIVGAGRIGQAVARRAPAFGMSVRYWSRTPKPELEASQARRASDLEGLLRESDVVVLTVALTAETHHLIGDRELSFMKKTSFLINIARGPVVDEAALARALEEGKIAGAGLDVYEKEPEVHPGLLRSPQAVLVPHIGSATIETRRRMAVLAVENCRAALEGRVPPLALNRIDRAGPAGGRGAGSREATP
jgi:glyoxylate reductase